MIECVVVRALLYLIEIWTDFLVTLTDFMSFAEY